MNKKDIEKREEFLQVYSDFDRWLKSIGFCAKHSNTPDDCFSSFYLDYVDPLYGVEHYTNDVLRASVRFCRDINTHTFIIIPMFGICSDKTSLEDLKSGLLKTCVFAKTEKLKELNNLNLC